MFYHFCPHCGEKLKPGKAGADPVCGICGFIFYQNSVPAFGALIINSRGQLMLAKRKFPPQAGKWDLPGGFLKNGEAPEQALARELKEELGITVGKCRLLDLEVGDYVFQGRKFKTLNLFYLINSYRGQIKPQDDVADVKWFDKDSLPPMKDWSFRWLPKAIKKWKE